MVVWLVQGETGDAQAHFSDEAVDSVTARFFNSDFSNGSMNMPISSVQNQNFNADSTEGWLHFVLGIDIIDSQQDSRLVRILDSNPVNGIENIVLELRGVNGALQLFQRIGASLVAVGLAVGLVDDVTLNVDINWRFSTTDGLARWYLDDVLRATSTASFSSTLFQKVNKLQIFNHRGGTETARYPYFSEIIAADEPTIGWHLATMVPDGEGNSTAWATPLSTKVDAVNETGRGNGTRFINAASTNLVNTWTLSSLSTVTDPFDIKAVAVVGRVNRGVAGPQNVNLAVRTGGSNFYSTNVAIDSQYQGVFNVWDTNPNTSSAWVSTELNSLEIGVRSRT